MNPAEPDAPADSPATGSPGRDRGKSNSAQDVNASELAPYPFLSDSSGRLSGHFPAAACRCALSDTPQLAAAGISLEYLRGGQHRVG